MTNRYEVFGVTYKNLEVLKYKLLKQYKIEIDLSVESFELQNATYIDGELRLHRGFAWDGSSGPSIDTDSFLRGSLVHDFLYIAIAEDYLTAAHRKLADKTLYKICREDGMNWVRANYVYYAVRVFGKAHTKRTV